MSNVESELDNELEKVQGLSMEKLPIVIKNCFRYDIEEPQEESVLGAYRKGFKRGVLKSPKVDPEKIHPFTSEQLEILEGILTHEIEKFGDIYYGTDCDGLVEKLQVIMNILADESEQLENERNELKSSRPPYLHQEQSEVEDFRYVSQMPDGVIPRPSKEELEYREKTSEYFSRICNEKDL